MPDASGTTEKSTKNAHKKQDKREKFVRLAEKRTINAIKTIRVLRGLGNKSAYDYTDADVAKIVKALKKEIDDLESKMKGSSKKDEIEFKL